VAEGKASAQRAALGAQMQRHPYGHWALAARLVSEQPHCGTARQWFRSPDILALLPFDRPEPQQSWGLVWSQPEAQAKAMLAWPVEQFEAALLEASHGAVGALRLASERALWPLAIAQAEPVVGPGWALVGDAAHVVHPLAGQGLNLGLADVLALDEVMAQREVWRELGDPALLARYARKRRLGTLAMAGGTDALWHLFASETPGLRELRNHGMSLVDHVAPLKRWLMGRAMSV
jgi:ubiquinone biosynthesis UbiH/UbiF/VisC/COQ6 family hydroxylase